MAIADTASMEVITLQNRPAAQVQPILTPLLESDEVVSGDGFNLIVKASPPRLEAIRTLIKRLDVRLHNLMISVLQSSRQTAEQLNAKAAILAAPSIIRMHGMTGDTRDFDSKRNTRQLRTLDGQPAHIQISQIKPVDNVTLYGSGYGSSGIAIDTHLLEAGAGFAVIPHLQGNDEIMLDIAPWSERFLRDGTIADQQVKTSIRARLGEWIAIGGIGYSNQDRHRGFKGLNYATRDHQTRILIKVDLAD